MKVSLICFTLFVANLAIVKSSDDEVLQIRETEAFPEDLEEHRESPFDNVKRKTIEDIPGLTEDMLTEIFNEAKQETFEEEMLTRLYDQQDGEPQTLQSSHYKRFVPELEPVRIGALMKEKTIKKLAQKLGMNNKEQISALEGLETRLLGTMCLRAPDSAASPHVPRGYRSIDGRGNNLKYPNRGRTNTPFSRIIYPDYADGISTPRRAFSGRGLPNARKVSSIVFSDKNRLSVRLSHMAMIWGQFVDHDITLTAEPRVNCHNKCGLHGECFGIPVSKDDRPFKGKTCIELLRSIPFCQPHRNRRDQINTLSSFIDASAVYSSDAKRFNSLRDPSDSALLKEQKHPYNRRLKNLLSPADKDDFCRIRNPNLKCFQAGDVRTNENSGLTSMHTIFNREHNRIVKKLRDINPHWNNDKLFFEARKIVGALVQHITYNEFLPLILSPKMRSTHGLVLMKKGYYYGYNMWINPSIFNSFSAAAYRFGHSLVQNMFHRFGSEYHRVTPSIQVNRFFDTVFLYQSWKGGVDSILRGLATESAQNVDGFFSKAIQEQLVRGPGDLADLPALNIQRGRDHGIPGYNQFRKIAGLKKAKTFADLEDVMTTSQIARLRKVYKNVNDVDLFVGGVYEKHEKGGSLGPTFSKIIATQFRRLRRGDRFWYENKGQFSSRQLQEIRKASLARVMCDNSDNIKEIHRRVLQVSQNKRTTCTNLPKVNLRAWK